MNFNKMDKKNPGFTMLSDCRCNTLFLFDENFIIDILELRLKETKKNKRKQKHGKAKLKGKK